MDQLLQKALECGFTHTASLDTATLEFMPEVRAMCASDRCKNYNRSWTCPPACGTLDEITEKVRGYSTGIIVQTVGELEDEFDIETMMEVEAKHQKNFLEFVKAVIKEYPRALPMGAGACRICESCSYPESPCLHPDLAHPSMEAYGLLVSDVCTKNKTSYNYGKHTVCYTSCVLIK